MLTGRGYSNPRAIQQFPTWLFVVTGMLTRRGYSNPQAIQQFTIPGCLCRQECWLGGDTQTLKQLAVYNLAVCVDRNTLTGDTLTLKLSSRLFPVCLCWQEGWVGEDTHTAKLSSSLLPGCLCWQEYSNRGYSNPQAIQQFTTWLLVLTGRLSGREYCDRQAIQQFTTWLLVLTGRLSGRGYSDRKAI